MLTVNYRYVITVYNINYLGFLYLGVHLLLRMIFLKVAPSNISKRTGLCLLHLACSSSIRDCKSGIFKYQPKRIFANKYKKGYNFKLIANFFATNESASVSMLHFERDKFAFQYGKR